MTKSELIRVLAERQRLPETKAEKVVNLLFRQMADALCDGERIEIRGFGSFSVRHYDGYTGRNPKTGSPIEVPPKRLPYFKVGKELKERLNTERDEGEE